MNEQENKDIFDANDDAMDNVETISEDTIVEETVCDEPMASDEAIVTGEVVADDDDSEIEVMDTSFFGKEQKEEPLEEEIPTPVMEQSFTTSEPQVQAVKKESFFKKHQKGFLLLGCFTLGLVGSLLGNFITGDFNQQSVMYQSVKTENVETSDIKTVAKNCAPSVVEIKTESVSTQSFFSNAISSGAGSGVILSADGYIVTNHHVIEDASKVSVTTYDGKTYDAKFIGTDQNSDLAVIKIEVEDLTPAIQGHSSSLEVGDTAIAIGNPLGELGGTVTSGIISALDREVTIDNQTMHLLQTNAAINPGNSGGGLFNAKGELIGVVNAKSSGENVEGLGFAIPIDRAKTIIENLIENGYVKDRATLGVSLSTSTNPYNNTESVYIYSLIDGGAAEKAGLKAGDQILQVNDTDIESASQLKDIITSYKVGDTVNISVLRNHEVLTVKVVLQENQEETQTSSTQNQSQNPYNSYGYDDYSIEDFFNYFGN